MPNEQGWRKSSCEVRRTWRVVTAGAVQVAGKTARPTLTAVDNHSRMKRMKQHLRPLWFPAVLTCLVGAAWAFPIFWYDAPEFRGTWFEVNEETAGWRFREIPVNQAAEKLLTADETTNGDYVDESGRIVRVFLSSRRNAAENDLQLFAHSPDLCWTEAGFKRIGSEPSVVQIKVHGMSINFERRIFEKGGHRELVYFGGMLGGVPLPFRLAWDQEGRSAEHGVTLRSLKRIPQAFWSRKTLAGPKQFLRISTPLQGDPAEEERLLEDFLAESLVPAARPEKE